MTLRRSTHWQLPTVRQPPVSSRLSSRTECCCCAVWTEFEYGRWVDALTRSLEKVRDSNFLMDATAWADSPTGGKGDDPFGIA